MHMCAAVEPSEMFVRQAMHDFIDFPLAKFHEIWTQHVYQYRDENFWNRILKILP